MVNIPVLIRGPVPENHSAGAGELADGTQDYACRWWRKKLKSMQTVCLVNLTAGCVAVLSSTLNRLPLLIPEH